ncbi:elongator complex protein 4 [Nomia melanderi]|uniref:elongator complex protein 4 n=1 Tax=Nomia melanderi TaxID=2448451 RepID=UPI0013040674|nr:elongator complex protein 4 [Nomia melanderi]XP_031849120.1 elongator complex protein 4 [Nomia melanderi]XP_031849121.1 elongator complex protein 4 [Nomia melanderi]XP_031849122.1 elongator complex protein 4 [Nomia melanderi]
MDLSTIKGSKFPFIPGTKPSIKNSQLLISSGIPSLDHIIGGGLPIGSLMVIEDDRYSTYAKVMLEYFIAEGVVTNQPVLIASKDLETSQFISELPAVITDNGPSEQIHHSDDQMKIAWRYQNMKVVDSSPSGGQSFGHFYDLKKTMDKETIDKADITHWYDNSCPTKDNTFENSAYSKLLQSIQETITKGQYSVSETPAKRQVLRIAIHSLGSRLWFTDSEENSNQDLLKFLYLLRVLLRYSYTVAVITIPIDCLNNSSDVVQRIEHLSDVSIGLESFMGSQKETNPIFKDYHGLLHLKKLPALNTIANHVPDSRDLVFKLRRRKFVIEVLHLPPELGDTTQREQDEVPSNAGCGGQLRKNFDF